MTSKSFLRAPPRTAQAERSKVQQPHESASQGLSTSSYRQHSVAERATAATIAVGLLAANSPRGWAASAPDLLMLLMLMLLLALPAAGRSSEGAAQVGTEAEVEYLKRNTECALVR